MIEVEVKGRASEEQMERVRDLVSEWDFLGEETQDDTYFSHPLRDFSESDEALRVRRVGDNYTLTYKGPKLDSVSKTREELEVVTAPEMNQILKRLGFRPVARIRKTRRNYSREGMILSIDDVENLGTFIELEADSNRPEDVKDLLKIFETLNLESETRSYLELFLEGPH